MAKAKMTGKQIDHSLKAIRDAENTKNNGKVPYILHGELAFEDPDVLFNVIELE